MATCSFDRTAAVWEEMPGDESSVPGAVVSSSVPLPAAGDHDASGAAPAAPKTHWVKRSSLVDSRTSVTDVKFAPKRLGLLLATCSSDGTVRVSLTFQIRDCFLLT